MDKTSQTKVTDNNRDQFYKHVYRQQFDSKSQLVELAKFSNDCVLIDCCGWHYRNTFPDKNTIILETVKNALQFKLDRNKFDKLIDDQQDHKISWPPLKTINPVLIFDRSPILKYRSVCDLVHLLSDVSKIYCASQLIVNIDTTFVDDPRMVDRFYNLSAISIPNFIVVEFAYKTTTNKLFIHFRRKHVG
jgi:hypothetical protein